MVNAWRIKTHTKHTLLWMCVLLFIATACHKKNAPTLSKKEMADLLVDMHMLEAFRDNTIDTSLNLHDNKVMIGLYADVFKKHDITPDNFNKNLEYYSKKPEQLNAIYDIVITKLKDIREKTPEPDQQKEKDSIKKADSLRMRDSIQQRLLKKPLELKHRQNIQKAR